MPDEDLRGAGVLITRPLQTADELIEAVERRGGRAIRFPVLEILPRSIQAIRTDADALRPADVTIFVSRNAASFGASLASGRIAAVGPSTAAALESAGRTVDILPSEGFDSEHLLEEPELRNATGKVFRIVRGNEGRELLADELEKRGGRVEYLAVYERRLPEYADKELAGIAASFDLGEIDAVVVMSVQSLLNLDSLLSANCAEALQRTLLVTPAARVLKEAQKHGADRPAVLAASPRTDDIVDAIMTATSELRRKQ